MKILIVFAFVVLSGCSIGPTMQELEDQALLTGDWSAVERRERSLARRKAIRGPTCPVGYIGFCVDRFYDKACSCVKREDLSLALSMY